LQLFKPYRATRCDVLVDRPRIWGALAQRLAVGLAGSSDVRSGDNCERDKLDGIDLDLTEPDPLRPP